VDLADARGRGRRVVELLEPLPPAGSELLGQDPMDASRWQWRCRLLQLREGGAVRSGDLLGQRCFEDGQRLTHLHGAALELTEHLEQMLGRTHLNLSGYDLAGHPR
jgi:hypothetical protein